MDTKRHERCDTPEEKFLVSDTKQVNTRIYTTSERRVKSNDDDDDGISTIRLFPLYSYGTDLSRIYRRNWKHLFPSTVRLFPLVREEDKCAFHKDEESDETEAKRN